MFYQIQGSVLILFIRVSPNARRSGIEGLWNGTHLKVALTAPPVDGKANECLIEYLSDYLEIRKSAIHIRSGQTGRQKVVEVSFSDTQTIEIIVKKLSQFG